MSRLLKSRRVLPALLAVVTSMGLATAAAGTASAAVRSGPRVLSFGATPDSLSYTGGRVRLAGRTSGASKCVFSSPYHITGLPATIACPGGSPGMYITIGKDTGNGERNFSFTLKAEASNGAYSAESIYLHQTPAPPFITSMTTSSSQLPASGGTVTVTAKVERANLCVFSSDPAFSGLPKPKQVPCSNGTATISLKFPATTTGTTQSFDIALQVAGEGGQGNTGSTTIYVQGQAPTVHGFSVSPSTVPDTGGDVTLTAYVAYGDVCGYGDQWKVEKGQPNPATNLPAKKNCYSGKITFVVKLRPNTTTYTDKIIFLMDVVSGGGKVNATNQPVVHLEGEPTS